MQALPKCSLCTQAASRTLTANQPSVAGAIPCSVRSSRASSIGLVLRAPQALALLVAVHDVLDELEDLAVARGLRLAVGEGLAPVGDLALLGHDVEERPLHLHAHAR